MKKRIFLSITSVTIISVLVFTCIISIFMYNDLFEQQKVNLQNEITYIEQAMNDNNYTVDNIKNLVTYNRITVIDEAGVVLFDNYKNAVNMENHADRPEVLLTLENGFGEYTRLSDTLGEQTYYYAKMLTSGEILRMAFTSSSIFKMLYETAIYIVLLAIVFVIITILISKILTAKILKPIYPQNPDIYDELMPFVRKISEQEEHINSQRILLSQKITEFNAISQNIADGLILIDVNSHIISVNNNALNTLGKSEIDFTNKPLIELTRNREINEAVEVSLAGEFVQIEQSFSDKYYNFRISPVFSYGKIIGSVILIVDYTLEKENEKIRREFSANVSHELKTPLTTISGYAELMKNGLVGEKDILPFAGKIYDEAQNLFELIEDIIKISRLDEDKLDFEFVEINLKDVLEKTAKKIEDNAGLRNISVATELTKIKINGILPVINEIFYNLAENAVKYNKDGGKITFSCYKDEKNAVIEISDTGIGIPSELRERIFERFYRVDKSRSRAIKGSGLGLSIVKHGVSLHKGEIEFISEENVGTTFKIKLPM